jgi:hypothetical protein
LSAKQAQRKENNKAAEVLSKIYGGEYIKTADKYCMPVKWLKVYIYLILPLWIVYTLIYGIKTWPDNAVWYNIVHLALNLFAVPVYICLRRLTKAGYYLNTLIFILLPLWVTGYTLYDIFVINCF